MFRENYNGPMQTLEQYLTMMHETQLNMYEALNLARKERFERNKKNCSQTPPRQFKPGDKVFAIPKRALATAARLDQAITRQ